MADPLSVVTSFAKTAKFCYRIISKMENCPVEIKNVNSEVANWQPQLEGVAELLEGNDETAIHLRDKLEDGGLFEVKNIVQELNNILMPFYETLGVRKKLKWINSTGKKVEELLSELRRYMEQVMRLVQFQSYKMTIGTKEEISEIRKITLDEYARRNILEWLRPRGIEADEFHRQKRALRQNGTCDWLAESPAWIDWCKGGSEKHSRFLWIRGLAGAGKTVLASFAIDKVLSMYKHKGVSYYYCSHERQKEGYTSAEETCSFLRWVVRDLTNQVTRPKGGTSSREAEIPQVLHDLYDKHDFEVGDLLDCLLAVTEHIAKQFGQQVYIIIDAVDECPSPREDFLSVITTIGTDQAWQHVSLCFTSRNEHDISKAIGAVQPIEAVQPRKILIPRSPRTIGRRAQSQSPLKSSQGQFTAITRGFDGMPPPGFPPPRGDSVRGRSPSLQISQSPNATHRASRSMDYGPHDMSFIHNERERAISSSQAEMTRGFDLMDIDPPGNSIPTGRKEGCTILSMDENPEVMKAIRTFVQSQLKGDSSDRQDGVAEVVTLIAQRARGMFRWAACQVDIINSSKLCDIDSISRMLDTIPTDIFGTYEHMIMKLLPDGRGENEHNRNFARTALALICSETSEVPCAEVLVAASRYHVPSGNAHKFDLTQLQALLGCLIKVTRLRKTPESMYSRNVQEDIEATSQVSVAHYTVKEYLFDNKTALGPVKDFALSTEAIQSLELLVIFSGLQQFGRNRPVDARLPTRYEEYCLRMTDKALRTRRVPIVRDQTVWKTVTECLKWDSNHHSPRAGAFPNMKIRTALSSWAKTSPFQQGKEPQHAETSVLVSLLLLQWPELAVVYLKDLPESNKKEVWRDKFQLARSFKVEGTDPVSLIQMCVTRRDVAFLQVLFDARADFSREKDLVMDLFYNAYGHRSLNDEDAGDKTGRMLKMLLVRGVRPEAPGYIFTPLQFAVSNLEERWVDDLLGECADPNAVGDPDGVHPFGAEHDDIQGHLTPLEICSQTTPEWLKSDLDAELIEDVRKRVEESLRRWGAVDGGTVLPLVEPDVVVLDDDE